MKSDMLVKTDERGLRIIQDAEGLFRAKDDPPSTLSRFVGLTRCEDEAIKSHKPVGFFALASTHH